MLCQDCISRGGGGGGTLGVILVFVCESDFWKLLQSYTAAFRAAIFVIIIYIPYVLKIWFSNVLIYLKPLNTQLIQILFFPVHIKVSPFICVFTSFPNVQERFSKTWARIRTSAKIFGEKCQIYQKHFLTFFST